MYFLLRILRFTEDNRLDISTDTPLDAYRIIKTSGKLQRSGKSKITPSWWTEAYIC